MNSVNSSSKQTATLSSTPKPVLESSSSEVAFRPAYRLMEVPALPVGITHLFLHDSMVQYLPTNWPATLTHLFMGRIPLMLWPVVWPEELIFLDISGIKKSPPEIWPAKLTHLYMACNEGI